LRLRLYHTKYGTSRIKREEPYFICETGIRYGTKEIHEVYVAEPSEEPAAAQEAVTKTDKSLTRQVHCLEALVCPFHHDTNPSEKPISYEVGDCHE
jgi:hypothetical protein